MKKLVIGMFAICLGLGMISCKGKADPKQGGADSAAAVVEEKISIDDVLAKAKAEGANWDEAQWKASQKDMMKCIAPMMKEIGDMQKQIEEADKGDEAAQLKAAAEIAPKLQEKMKEFEGLEKAINEYEKIVEANPIAKKVSDDEAFQEEMKKEFDLPEDF